MIPTTTISLYVSDLWGLDTATTSLHVAHNSSPSQSPTHNHPIAAGETAKSAPPNSNHMACILSSCEITATTHSYHFCRVWYFHLSSAAAAVQTKFV